MHEVKVSVIIPVFNTEKYLRKCLDSVIHQTLKDIEIVCVNDCSSDGSKDILLQYRKYDNRIIICDNPENSGLSFSRNKGISVAKGKYLFFLDSDDWLKLTALDELFSIAEDNETDVLIFDFINVFENKEIEDSYIEERTELIGDYSYAMSGKELFTRLRLTGGELAPSCFAFYRRDYLSEKQISFFDGILHEDMIFYPTVLCKAERAMRVENKYYYYFRRRKSIMTAGRLSERIRGLLTVYSRLCEDIIPLMDTEDEKKAIRQYMDNILGAATMLYRKLLRDGQKPDIHSIDSGYAAVTEMFIRYNSQEYCPVIEEKDLEMIRASSNIIVYGAGRVAREVAAALSSAGINEFVVAVSKPSDADGLFMGNKTICIDNLTSIKDDSLVLIAASKNYEAEMKRKLDELGFRKYLAMSIL